MQIINDITYLVIKQKPKEEEFKLFLNEIINIDFNIIKTLELINFEARKENNLLIKKGLFKLLEKLHEETILRYHIRNKLKNG